MPKGWGPVNIAEFGGLLRWGLEHADEAAWGVVVQHNQPALEHGLRLGEKAMWRDSDHHREAVGLLADVEEMNDLVTNAMDLGKPRTVSGLLYDGELLTVWINPLKARIDFWQSLENMTRNNEPLVWGARLNGDYYFSRIGQSPTWGDVPTQMLEMMASTSRGSGLVDDWWWERLDPDPVLIVVGTGHDAIPLVALAGRIGFRTVTIDPRPAFNQLRYFPGADRYVEAVSDVDPTRLAKGAFWVIMNHHVARDAAALNVALSRAPCYVGLMGTVARSQEVLTVAGRTAAEGPIRTPVGLDIGADSAEQVAISVCAEILEVQLSTMMKRDET